jgi:hypothetical protein
MPAIGLGLALPFGSAGSFQGPVAINYLLLETSDYLLLETSDKLIL